MNPSSAQSKKIPKDDLKTFIKIKPHNEDERQYYKVNEEKNKFTLFDPTRMGDTEKNIYFEMDKIFTDDSNSYIYEEICRDVCSESIEGQSFCFITGGLTKSGKKSLIFGREDSLQSLNSRGLIFRIIEAYLNLSKSNEFSIEISMIGVYDNKYIDISKLFDKKNLEKISEKELYEMHTELKPTEEISKIINKKSVNDLNTFISLIIKILEIYLKLDAYDRRILTRTTFINIIHIIKKGVVVSTVTFCTMAGNEKIGLGKTFDAQKTRDSINSLSYENALFNVLCKLKASDSEDKNVKEIPFSENCLTFCLKNYLISNKIRIISCIFPGAGYINTVKNTLMFPFKLRKNLLDLKKEKKEVKPENQRDDEIYQYRMEINGYKQIIEKLNREIADLKKDTETKDQKYKINLETIKKNFNFDGDINKLVINDEYSKEAIYARRIRESGETVKVLTKKISEMEKRMNEIIEENKNLEREKKERRKDVAMVTIYNKIKEDNQLEENKLKILLDHSKEVDNLKANNDQLTKQIEYFKKELESRSKVLKNLPNVLNENCIERKNIALVKEESTIKFEKQYQENLQKIKSSYEKEAIVAQQKNTEKLNQKNDEIIELKNQIKELKKQNELEVKKYIDEMLRIYDYFNKFTFQYKGLRNINITGNLIRAKEEVDRKIDEILLNINRISFPLLFLALSKEKSNNQLMQSNSFKESNSKNFILTDIKKDTFHKNPEQPIKPINDTIISSDLTEEIEKIFPKRLSFEELQSKEKSDLIEFIINFEKKTHEIEEFANKLKKYKNKIPLESPDKKTVNDKEIENLRKRLEEQTRINFSNRMIIESQERMIEKHNTNLFLNKHNPRPLTGFSELSNQINNNQIENKRTVSASTKNTSKFRPYTGRPFTSKDKNSQSNDFKI